MSYLLDTCVLSELVARRPDERVVRWVDSIVEERLFLSAVTIGEMVKGIEKLPDSARRERLTAWLEQELLFRFRNRIVAIDTDVMFTWGVLTANLEKQGKPMPAVDSLIAATALHRKLSLVTRNEGDFAHAGVTVVNPWKEPD